MEIPTDGGFRIAWDTIDLMGSIHGEWIEPKGHRMVLAFACEDPEQVNELYQRVIGKGYSGLKEPWDAFWGQRYAVVEDPDGNLVDLFAGLE